MARKYGWVDFAESLTSQVGCAVRTDPLQRSRHKRTLLQPGQLPDSGLSVFSTSINAHGAHGAPYNPALVSGY
jgi:hypothetical protein